MPVEEERRGAVLVVTLRREEKRNAIDPDTTLAIDAAFNRFEDDPELRVGILSGGPAMFSAGSDLKLSAGPPTERGGEYGLIRRRRAKPVIAAVEGLALGGGMELVLACDLVVASRTARFGLPEVRRALVPTCGGLFRPLRALPLNVARELLLTGEPLDAERAYGLGLVNRLTDPGGTLDAALELAGQICANGPVALRESLAAIQHVLEGEEEAGWRLTGDATRVIFASADAREGRDAFLERRPPVWSGR